MDKVITIPVWLGVVLILALIAFYAFIVYGRRRRIEQQARVSPSLMAGAVLSIGAITWKQFNLLVSQAFRQRGYMVGGSGDAATDGATNLVLRKGGEYFLVECKHWRNPQIDVAPIRELHNEMRAKHAAGGFVVTIGGYTREALAFASGRKIQLIDGPTLREMLNDTAGPATGIPTEIPTIITLGATDDTPVAPPCPLCNSPTVLRMAPPGSKAKNFWGCSRFPICKGSVDAD